MSARTLSVLGAALALASASALAADAASQLALGQQEFRAKCAPCHGATGKGNGPQAAELKVKVPDLTTYAKRNGGTLPDQQAWATIDGRQLDDRAQQTRTMPAWGHMFRRQARGEEVKDAEPYIKERIDAIVAYLRSIQVK